MFSKVFSRFSFRAGAKRPSNVATEEEAPQEKVSRCELDEDDEENLELPEELLAHLKKYSTKHFSDKVIKEKILDLVPIPKNAPKPPEMDLYIKDLVNESVFKPRITRLDSFLVNVQHSIRSILGPVSHLWVAVNEERETKKREDQDLTGEEKEATQEELQRLEDVVKTLDTVVTLVGQAIQRTSYYRRFMILDTLITDNKTAKSMLSDWEKTISDNDSNSLFGNKFEEELCRSAKTKKKTKEVLKGLMSPNTPAKQKPFQKGPRPSFSSRGGRGQSSGFQQRPSSFWPRFPSRGNFNNNNNFRGGRGRGGRGRGGFNSFG
ncbi:uncharacterized protein [Clytia hemisphaerica]|uniref:uncharacterized protein n=1 Tax=Clytia hemisphaerica TaxID=252671 RepID=UPI0034D5BD0B